MKRFTVILYMLAVIFIISGCGINDDWWDPTPAIISSIVRISQIGTINRPLIGGGDDWTRSPLNRTVLIFSTGKDQYGNPVGLSDDTSWTINDVTIKCSSKDINDTVYNPGDPFKDHGFSSDGILNSCMWYPTYTAEYDDNMGLPYSLSPEVGYPFRACENVNNGEYPAQTATITARARTDSVRVKITAPNRGTGTYTLDLPGAVPQSSNILEVSVGEPGLISIVWENDGSYKTYTVTVPVEWFWCSGSWVINVMATGEC